MVTHSSTSRPVQCLCMAERTKCFLLTRKSNFRILKVEFLIPGIEFQNPGIVHSLT
jgi:hypothetical protein